MLSGEGPIFLQLAQRVAEDIINGTYAEDAGIPSTHDFAIFYRMSPITSAKGITMLVDQGVLYKKRGIGMFVAPGAREHLLAERRAAFRQQHVAPLLHEAELLGIDRDELADMIKEKDPS
ncbi:DNA-binding transcriptional regulator YhcF (GntR family) [Cryobacterium mesophilum]|uniref:GntR family transcriptional regulator n=1 Tax=Terrimesophilobacter mesophilus TaxID=433647 RepID=A0A4R8VB70_9MICO|nr:GntR family transcriptional regulator [Terrimesophilobacter mesophilus]MBB5633854.1 DNA-binding transcriptional regulator YhcF (GntR family) [Terrimesophilobacter mesophilus]TFB80531.1 GntR family transcriptional regulator [Terrimesophilobacter mesophilus]